ncbi:uncharacterized protein LOC113536973 [Pangasianodon hypophthalmus]|uniref:uncharacterized protein LOC113536973 n=1 Tax=Pangasianodon hypophthalmus TaxID=310915 RepID=UPI002307008C|nr:uncharacterized protein LOC113536973 [Pangasianodon hypophthalmus]
MRLERLNPRWRRGSSTQQPLRIQNGAIFVFSPTFIGTWKSELPVYHRQTLTSFRNNTTAVLHDDLLEKLRDISLLRGPGLQPSASPDAGGRGRGRRKRCMRKQKRGKRAGVRARLKTNPSRPALPSILLSNVCSLDNKLDYTRLQQTTRREFRDCCVFVFTETWLSDRVPDAAIQLDGQASFPPDRNTALCGFSFWTSVSPI